MSNLSFTLRDSATMLRRDIRHSLRNLSMTLSGLLTPTIMLALFVYVFGDTMRWLASQWLLERGLVHRRP
jgi:ABC-2 type transport system permease protein